MADALLIDAPRVRGAEPPSGLEKEPDALASVVNDDAAASPARHLPQMVIATTIVAVLPLAASLALRISGVISSGWLSVGLAVALSLAASSLGSAYWRKRGGHGEVLFSELLLWGWIRSWRHERELANATRLLTLVNHDAPERREHLLRQLAEALEGQDVYLNGHSRRVARHATMIARGMGLSSAQVARVRAAAMVHDIGKLRTPKAILNKPGRLTDEEFEVIKLHPVDGAHMVAALGDLELVRIVRHHHERLDGAGYPDRLAGEEIPLGARIIAVADTFDAITSARPYRAAAPHQKAIDILRQEAGTQLDPDAVRAFLAYYSGNRPTVVWAILTSSVRRLVSWLTGDPAAAATISASKVAAATAATAAIGAAAGAIPVALVHHPPRAKVVAHAMPVSRRRAAPAVHRVAGSPVSADGRGVGPAHPGAVKPHRAAAHAARAHAARAHAGRTPRRAAQPHGAPAPHARSHTSASAGSSAAGPPRVAGARSAAGNGGAPRSTLGGQGTSVRAAPVKAPVAAAAPPSPSAPAPAPARATPPGHSEESRSNGNAYGHSKTRGSGHGKSAGNSDVTPAIALAAIPQPSTGAYNGPVTDGNSQGRDSHGGSKHAADRC